MISGNRVWSEDQLVELHWFGSVIKFEKVSLSISRGNEFSNLARSSLFHIGNPRSTILYW